MEDNVKTSIAECTVPEKILLAANQLEEEGQSPFSAEALIVVVWQKFPKTFGLKGYADQYPDSNKVLSSIMGEKGLTRRGWLAKMGQKLYSLTRDGRQVVRRLLQDGEPVRPGAKPSVKLSRDLEKFLLGALATSAAEKYQQGLKPDLTFGDACRFWGLNESQHGDVVDTRLDRFRANLAEIDHVVGATGTDLSNGRSIAPADTALLYHVDDYLKERFGRHLSLLRTRSGR